MDLTFGGFMQLIIQAGALGLLAIIVYNIPRIMKEVRDWRDTSDKNHRDERQQWELERGALLATYKAEAKYEREAAKMNFDSLVQIGERNQANTRDAIEKLGQAVSTVAAAVKTHDALARTAIEEITKPKNGNHGTETKK